MSIRSFIALPFHCVGIFFLAIGMVFLGIGGGIDSHESRDVEHGPKSWPFPRR